jgi:hypothetical protein
VGAGAGAYLYRGSAIAFVCCRLSSLVAVGITGRRREDVEEAGPSSSDSQKLRYGQTRGTRYQMLFTRNATCGKKRGKSRRLPQGQKMTSGLVSGQIGSPGGGVRRRCRPPPVQKRWELAGSNGREREQRAMDDRDGGVVEEGGDRGVGSAAVPLGLTPAFLASLNPGRKAKVLQSVDMQRDQSTSPGDGLRGRDVTHRRPPRFQFSLRLGRHGDVWKDATTQDGEQKCRFAECKARGARSHEWSNGRAVWVSRLYGPLRIPYLGFPTLGYDVCRAA